MSKWYEKYQVDIPEGQSGNWKIEKFTVNENELSQRLSMIKYGRGVPGGAYTRLSNNGHVVMSDTPDEISDQLCFIEQAKGDVLIVGLGLGVTLQAVAKKEEVSSVTVIEKSQDVINLVAGYYYKLFLDKLLIIEADIFEWKTYRYFDCAWYDIWNDLCTDNLEEMAKLHRRFAKKTGWQGSWGKEELKSMRRRGW